MLQVGDAVLGYWHRPARKKSYGTRNTLRLAEVERLRAYRRQMTTDHGQIFENTDEAFLSAIMPELLLEADLPRRPAYRATPIAWATAIVPSLLARPLTWFDDLEQACLDAELCGEVGDDGGMKAAYRGGC